MIREDDEYVVIKRRELDALRDRAWMMSAYDPMRIPPTNPYDEYMHTVTISAQFDKHNVMTSRLAVSRESVRQQPEAMAVITFERLVNEITKRSDDAIKGLQEQMRHGD